MSTKKDKVPTIFIEVYDRRDSGFVQDNTEGTKHEVRLDCPSRLNIPNVSFRRKEDGISNEKIRWIAGEDVISIEEQKKRGIEPNRVSNVDKIYIDKGTASVADEGANRGLYRYLNDTFFNASNPNRSDNAAKLFKVVDLNKIQEEKNELEIARHDAKGFVYSLQEKKGKEWVYQTERINALCELFSVYAELMPTKIEMLAKTATLYPVDFMEKVTKFEQTVNTMVAHALQLNVIKFDGNVSTYANKNKIIKNLGTGNMKNDVKIDELATYLRTKDGYEAYQELVAEVEAAKEKKANS